MQISSKELLFFIGTTTVIFLIAPLFLIVYVNLYNRRKKKHAEEKESLKQAFDTELLKTQMEVQEQTLKTIGYDLHDNIGQLLGLTVMTLGSINIRDTEKAGEKVAAAEALAKRAVKELRALSRLLHGEELLHRGLVDAIAFELEYLERSDLFKISYTHPDTPLPPLADKVTIVFRLFQEILNNIVRHAQANEIVINLATAGNVLTLSIQDNGSGFDVTDIMKQHRGMGLQNIQKRAGMIGGQAQIQSAPGAGTTIKITIPY